MKELFTTFMAAMTALFTAIFNRADERDEKIASLEKCIVAHDERIAALEAALSIASASASAPAVPAVPAVYVAPAEDFNDVPWALDISDDGDFNIASSGITPESELINEAIKEGGKNLNRCPTWADNVADIIVTYYEGDWYWSLEDMTPEEMAAEGQREYKQYEDANVSTVWRDAGRLTSLTFHWWKCAKYLYNTHGIKVGEFCSRDGLNHSGELVGVDEISDELPPWEMPADEPAEEIATFKMPIEEVATFKMPAEEPATFKVPVEEPAESYIDIVLASESKAPAPVKVVMDEDECSPKSAKRSYSKSMGKVYRNKIRGAATWAICYGTLPNGTEMTSIEQACLVMELEYFGLYDEAAAWSDRFGPHGKYGDNMMFQGDMCKAVRTVLHECIEASGNDVLKARYDGAEKRYADQQLVALRAKYTSTNPYNQPMIAALLATDGKRIVTKGKSGQYVETVNRIDGLLMKVRNELLGK